MMSSTNQGHGVLHVTKPSTGMLYYLTTTTPDAMDVARRYYVSQGYTAASYDISSSKWEALYGNIHPLMPMLEESICSTLLAPIAEESASPVFQFGILGNLAARLGSVGHIPGSKSHAGSLP